MTQQLAVGACSLMVSLAGVTAVLRAWPGSSGRHRAVGTPAAAPEPMLRPIEALDQFEAYCPAEDRPTLQIRLRLGGELCTECRNPSHVAALHTQTAEGD